MMGQGKLIGGLSFRFGFVAIVLLGAVTLLPLSIAAPHQNSGGRNTCTPSCRRSHDTKLKYEADKSYTYEFETESITQLLGASDEQSKLKVKGQVILTSQSPCDFLLTIHKTSIQTASGQSVDRPPGLEGSSVRFAYQDGGIEGLCVDESDPTWSANIKRAIVSMLQNKAVKNTEQSIITETDISGRCPTQYVVSGDRYTKTRDLNSCTHREGGNLIFHGVPYNVQSKHNSIPGMNSTFTCTQQLHEGVFKSIRCEENHKLKAFSREEAGAHTAVKSTLTFVSAESGHGAQSSRATSPTTPCSILYDHADSQQQLSSRQKSASSRTLDILNKICPEIESGSVSSKVPGLFLQLKKQLKFTRGSDLKAIREQINGGKLCEGSSIAMKKLDKLFLDAAAMSASDGAIALLAEADSAGQLEFESQSYFYLYTSFASRPGQRGLAAMGKLLKSQDNPSSGLLLAASGLAHQYCKLSNPNCGENEDYKEISDGIAREASRNCLARNELKIEKAVAALQALGNLDVLSTEGVSAVTKCLQGSERILIRALDAFRRNPCNQELKKEAQNIFGNKKKSSEIRIQAYLASSKCMQSQDVQFLQEVLNHEKSRQVSSFIVSHIQNQLKSSTPDVHRDQKSLLKRLELPRNVPQDVMKYSRNIQYSLFDEQSNLGGIVDGNMIFSQNSYVPSILSANVTVHAIGRSYNLFEFGCYLNDFDHLIEKHFGPASKFRNSEWTDLLKSGQDQLSEFGSQVSDTIQNSRQKRSHHSRHHSKKNKDHSQADDEEITSLNDKEIDAYQNEVEIEKRFSQSGIADAYVRIMGTSILVDSLSQNTLRQFSLSSSILSGIEKFMEGAKNHKVDLTQPILFMDEEVVIPTISGFPINMEMEGTTILSLQLNGKVNFGKLFKHGKDSSAGESEDLKIRIIPSSATTIRARMSMGSGPVETGLQLEGKMHSATGLDMALKNEPGKFDLKVNLPFEKNQLLELTSGLYWVETVGDNLEQKSAVTTKAPLKEYGGAFNGMNSEILGLRLAAKVQMPVGSSKSPLFPFTGPSIIAIGFEKSDPSMQGYHVRVLSNLEGPHEKTFSILLDTPGSKINRKISAIAMHRTQPNTKFQLDVDSPWKKFTALYKLQDTDALKALDLALSTDGEEYGAKAHLKMKGDSMDYELEPLLEFSSTTGGVHKYVEGKISRVAGKELHVDLKTDTGSFEALVGTVKADIEVETHTKGSIYKLSTVELNYPAWGVGKLGLSGNVKLAEPTYDVNVLATYGESSHTLSIDALINRQRGKLYSLKTNVTSSRNEAANFKLDWELKMQKQSNAFENRLEFVHGLSGKQLTIKQHSLYDTESSKNYEILNSLQVTRPSTKTDYLIKFDAKKIFGQSQVFDLALRNGASHRLELNIKSGADVFFDYNLKAAIAYPGQSYEFVETATKTSDDTWRYNTVYTPSPGDKYIAVTTLKLKNERNDVENSLATTVTSPALKQPIVFKSGVVMKSSTSSAFLLVQSEGHKQVDMLTEYKHYGGKPHAINMKAFVKNYIEANINETHTRSSSNLNVNVDWKPTDRRVILESLLKLQGEQLSLDGTLKWDAGKDDTQIAKIKSVTIFGVGWSMDSNNDFSIQGKSRNIRLKGKLGKDVLNGEHLLDMSYKNPENKNVALYVRNVMESTTNIKLSKLNMKLQLLDSQPAEMEWENRVANIDTSQFTFEILSDMNIKYGGDKNMKWHGEVNSKIGNRRVFNGLFEMSGSAMAKPLSLDYNTEIKQGSYKTSINSKYGNKPFNMDLGFKFDKWSPKKTADLIYKLALPIHPQSLEGSIKYTYIFDSFRAFEMTEVGSVSVNHGVATSWSNTLRSQDNEFEALSEVNNQGHPLLNFGLTGKKDKRRFTLDLQAILKGHGAKFFTNVEGKFPYYNLRANGSVTPSQGHKVKGQISNTTPSKSYDFKLYHRSAQGDQSIETDLTVNQNGDHFTLQNKIENFPKRKSVDLLFTDGTTPRKVYLLVTNQDPKWSLDSFVKWGEGGKTLKSKGGLEWGNEAMDAVLSLDSPALNVDKWSGRASRKHSNGRHSIAVNVEGRNEKIAAVGVEYAQKKERSGETYDGSLKIDARAARFHGSFRVEDGVLDKKRDGEDGRQVRATVSLDDNKYPLNLTLLTRVSDLQKRVSLSFCNKDDQDCKIGDIQFRHEYHNRTITDKLQGHEEEVNEPEVNSHGHKKNTQDVDYTLKATRQAISSGQRSTDGIVVRFSRANHGRELEHTAELIINEEKTSQMGYRLYRKAGKEVGVEVSLPERVMSAVATATRNPGNDSAQLNVWMNKKNVNDKLTVFLSMEDIPKAEDKSEGVRTSIVLKHPSLPQDMKLKSKLIQGGHENVLDFDVEFDVFKTNGPLVLSTKVQREPVKDGQVYKIKAQSRSQNTALNFGIESEALRTTQEVSLKTDINYRNRKNETKTSNIDFTYSDEHANFAITAGESQPLVSWSTTWNAQGSSSSSYDIRYEFLFPGMADARIFDCQLHPSIPPHANIKMYTAHSAPGNFYQTFIGFKSNKQFTAGLYRQQVNDRHVIGDLNLALNSSRLLFVKADWDTKNIQSALTDAQTRLEQTGEKFKSVVSQNLVESTKEIQFILRSFNNTLPDLQPIYESYKADVLQIRAELKNNSDTNAIYNYMVSAEKFVEKHSIYATMVFESIYDAFAFSIKNTQSFLNDVPEFLQNVTSNKLPNFVQNLSTNINEGVDTLVNGLQESVKKVSQIFEKISHFSNDYVNWDFLNDTGSGIGKYLKEALDYSVEKFTVIFEALKDAGSDVLENSYVKDFLKRVLVRYRNILGELVEQLKNQADGFRKSMLDAFPQQETQEFLLSVFAYAEKKATRVAVNDTAEQKLIYEKFVTALQKSGSEIWSVDWENGLILVQLPLPKPVDSLSDFNRLFLIDMPAWHVPDFKRPAMTYGLGEFYNFVKSDSLMEFLHKIMFSTQSVVPPGQAYAMLVGSQYIRTFDGKFYHFEGNCQYLLGSDFVDKNFTLAIDFDGDGPKIKKTILINYHGEQAAILPDFTTQLKHARNEEAEDEDELEVDKSEDGFITVRAQNGALEVKCAKKQDVCTFVLNGFYHGKTMGLLGTNNHEEFDDFQAPNGNLLEKSDEFVASWKLDRQCSEKAIPPHPANAAREAQMACASAFTDRYSVLSPCFQSVDPAPFKKLCEALSSEKSYDNRKAVCSSTVAYTETCDRNLIRVQPPSQC